MPLSRREVPIMPSRAQRVAALRKLLLEFFVIVMGVLTALGVDEWRTHRAEEVREGEILEDLLEEFHANRQSLASDLANNRRMLEASLAWTDMAENGTRASPDSVARVWEQLRGFMIFQPFDGVLQSVTDAGEFRLLDDPALRAQVAGWVGLVSEVSESQRLVSSIIANEHRSVLIDRPLISDPATAVAALRDPVLTNSHLALQGLIGFSVERTEDALARLDEIIVALEAAVASH